jgi:hypothetical protein
MDERMNRRPFNGAASTAAVIGRRIIREMIASRLLNPEGKRKKSRPRMGWMDGVEKDLRNLGVVNWKTKAQDGMAVESF